jgi:hypothetical protein
MVMNNPVFHEEGSGLPNGMVFEGDSEAEIKKMEKKLLDSRTAFFNMLRDLDFSYKELKKLYESLVAAFINALDA